MVGPDRSTRDTRIAGAALAGHALLLIASGAAFATFLAPPSPAWLTTPANQRVAALMFTFGGQATVVLGAARGSCSDK